MEESRKKKENKIGDGGYTIDLRNPKEFENSMKVLVMESPKTNEDDIKMGNFNTKISSETQTASMTMASVLVSNLGATIIDDQPGKESII